MSRLLSSSQSRMLEHSRALGRLLRHQGVMAYRPGPGCSKERKRYPPVKSLSSAGG